MFELHGERIVEQIAPPGIFEEQPCCGWNEAAVDVGQVLKTLPARRPATSAPK